MSGKKRCFVAVNLPAEIKREIFEKISKKFPPKDCKVVPQENLHITLAFLGYANEEEIAQAHEKMRALQEQKAFEIELNGFGDFNNRVFWVGIPKGAEELKAIAEKLQKIVRVQDERFSAHLTVARNKSIPRKEAREIMKKIEQENFSANFRAETIDLMESVLSPKGPKYEKLFSIALAH